MKKGKIKKRDMVTRDNIEGLDVVTKTKLLAMRKKAKRAINTVFGIVRRIENNGEYAQVKWLGRHKVSRELTSRLTTIRRRGDQRG